MDRSRAERRNTGKPRRTRCGAPQPLAGKTFLGHDAGMPRGIPPRARSVAPLSLIAVAIALFCGCAAMRGGGGTLPWSSVERAGGIEDVDSTLTAIELSSDVSGSSADSAA